jgi:hypothetical protein
MKGLIRGLLTDIESRFGYDHLLKHSFFKDVQWSSLATGTGHIESQYLFITVQTYSICA